MIIVVHLSWTSAISRTAIFTTEGRGAGFARNIGLKHAKGDWLVFADADDFFTDDFSSILDEMVDAKEDLIFFASKSVLSDDPTVPAVRTKYLNEYISAFLNGEQESEANLRCRCPIPTCKIIRRSIVEKNNISFSETMWSNDVFFSAQVSCFADSIRVTDKVGYVFTVRTGSLVFDFCGSRKEVLDRIQETLKSERLYARHRIPQPQKLSDSYLQITYHKHGFWWCLLTDISYLFHYQEFKAMSVFLLNKVLKHFIHSYGRKQPS